MARGLPLDVIVSALLLQITINFLFMGKIEGDGAVDLSSVSTRNDCAIVSADRPAHQA
jgi:hypothetical protein